MFSKNFIFALFGIILAIFAIKGIDRQPVLEGYVGNYPLTRITQSVSVDKKTGRETSINNIYPGLTPNPGTYGNEKFVKTPAFQANISPRFSNVSYGANIKYNMPSRENMAVPRHPLNYSSMAEENYTSKKEEYENCRATPETGCNNSPPTCGKGGMGIGSRLSDSTQDVRPNYHAGNWQTVSDSLPSDGNMVNSLPIGSMTTTNEAGETEQNTVFQRLTYSPAKNRGYAQSDYIRGDLPITPCSGGWFSVYPTVATALNPGALVAMTGDSTTNLATLALISSAAGGKTSLGGGNTAEVFNTNSINMSTQAMNTLAQGNSSLVTAVAF
jgi:Family of unknown function (DUF5850)